VLGRRHAATTDIVVAIAGLVVVAVGRAEIVGLMIGPRPTPHDPLMIDPPSY